MRAISIRCISFAFLFFWTEEQMVGSTELPGRFHCILMMFLKGRHLSWRRMTAAANWLHFIGSGKCSWKYQTSLRPNLNAIKSITSKWRRPRRTIWHCPLNTMTSAKIGDAVVVHLTQLTMSQCCFQMRFITIHYFNAGFSICWANSTVRFTIGYRKLSKKMEIVVVYVIYSSKCRVNRSLISPKWTKRIFQCPKLQNFIARYQGKIINWL